MESERDGLIAIVRPCACAGRRLPLRLHRLAATLIAQSTCADTLVTLTYRCPRCRTIVALTAADVRRALL